MLGCSAGGANVYAWPELALGEGEGFSAVSLVMRREHVAVAARPCRFLSPRAVLSRVNFFLVRSMRQRLFLIFSSTPAHYCSDSKVVHKEETRDSRPPLLRFVFLCAVTRRSHNGWPLARPAVVSKTLYANHTARYILLPSRLRIYAGGVTVLSIEMI